MSAFVKASAAALKEIPAVNAGTPAAHCAQASGAGDDKATNAYAAPLNKGNKTNNNTCHFNKCMMDRTERSSIETMSTFLSPWPLPGYISPPLFL
jgi:hypothetical protein